jgi:hypothetical protein
MDAEIDSILGNYHAQIFKKQEILEIAKSTGIKIEAAFEYDTYDEQAAQTNDKNEKEVLDRCPPNDIIFKVIE